MDEVIVIAPYDPVWPMLYDREKRLIIGAIGEHIVRIEHIGSTAVLGLGAKPVIDIAASLHTLSDLGTCISALKDLGYEHRGEAGIPGRQFFLKVSRESGKRTHHVHLVDKGSQFLDEQILFRDYLRQRRDVAEAYAHLKRALAAQYGNDRETYSNSKTEFINAVLCDARTSPSFDGM